MPTKVFVYGTLKREFGNNCAIEDGEFLGLATITGPYGFVNLGWYPAVAKLPDDGPVRQIGGEVWEIESNLLDQCDMIEGHPSYYRREKVETTLGKAWVYMLPAQYADAELVETLFWRQSQEENEWEYDNVVAA